MKSLILPYICTFLISRVSENACFISVGCSNAAIHFENLNYISVMLGIFCIKYSINKMLSDSF